MASLEQTLSDLAELLPEALTDTELAKIVWDEAKINEDDEPYVEIPTTFGHHSESSPDTIPRVLRTLFRKFFGHVNREFEEAFSDNKMFLVS